MEFKHYSVYGEIINNGEEVTVFDNKIKFTVYEGSGEVIDGEYVVTSKYVVVDKEYLKTLLNVEFDMNKDDKFVSKLSAKIEKLMDKVIN